MYERVTVVEHGSGAREGERTCVFGVPSGLELMVKDEGGEWAETTLEIIDDYELPKEMREAELREFLQEFPEELDRLMNPEDYA